jgi:hypothetical protein
MRCRGYTQRATMPTPEATYCHACAATRQLLYPLPADPLTTAYQLRKYTKHTVVDPTCGLQGIFASSEAKVYADYLVDTRAAGGVIVDAWNRFNIVLCAGREVGYHYEHGQLIAPADAIQQMLSSDEGRVHAYPIQSSRVTGRKCDDCGGWALVV